MSGFSADWLALREEADSRSRSGKVLAAARARFVDASEISICDLGSGTGVSVESFTGLFPPRQRWRLVDIDADNLQRARVRNSGRDELAIETVVHDLAAAPAIWGAGTDLVTATALFDLVSRDWLEGFVAALAEARLPLLATLTYDGRHVFSPEHRFDDVMHRAFDFHQTGEKSFGLALGPSACTTMIEMLRAHGYEVTTGDSAWQLSAGRDGALIEELLRGWAAAVTDAGLVEKDTVDVWLKARIGCSETLLVGHTDIFAVPGR
ncbi:MAG: class I SAM-dependent methyltransferase [Pseudomonadota bacterium]